MATQDYKRPRSGQKPAEKTFLDQMLGLKYLMCLGRKTLAEAEDELRQGRPRSLAVARCIELLAEAEFTPDETIVLVKKLYPLGSAASCVEPKADAKFTPDETITLVTTLYPPTSHAVAAKPTHLVIYCDAENNHDCCEQCMLEGCGVDWRDRCVLLTPDRFPLTRDGYTFAGFHEMGQFNCDQCRQQFHAIWKDEKVTAAVLEFRAAQATQLCGTRMMAPSSGRPSC